MISKSFLLLDFFFMTAFAGSVIPKGDPLVANAVRNPGIHLPLNTRQSKDGLKVDSTKICSFHTTITEHCLLGTLQTFMNMPYIRGPYGTDVPELESPINETVPVQYNELNSGPYLWGRKLTSRWMKDHMEYRYITAWSDDTSERCSKGDWTAGTLECGKDGALDWRVRFLCLGES